MLFYAITGLINAILGTLLGLVVYFKNKEANINKTFARFCVAVAIWSYCYFLWQISTTYESALFWSRALMMGSIFIPVTFFHFVITFLSLDQVKKKLLFFGYTLSFTFLILNFTPLFVKNVEPALSFPYWPKPGIAFHFFHLMFVSYAFYFWYLLAKTYQKSKGIQKVQIKYILTGSLVGFIGGATNHFLWYNILIPPFGNFAPALGFLLVGYAVLKHHLMNIRVIATELFTGLIIVTVLIYTVFSPSFQEFLIRGSVFLIVMIFGIFLIRGTLKEIESLERIAIQERALRQRSEKLVREFERLDRAKTQFLLATQHHLRTPLSIMKNYASMLLEGTYGKLGEIVKHPLSGIYVSIERLIKVVNEFLDVAQLQLGKGVLKKAKTDMINYLKKEIIEELLPSAKEKGLYLKLEPSKEKIPEIMIDQTKMKTAIYNVVDNGLKYTQKGGVTIKLQIVNGKLQIVVKDTGIGIKKEEIAELFERTFERGKEAEKLYTTGRGIGLYISKNFIEAHQGKIWAESEGKGKGSTFYIELPRT